MPQANITYSTPYNDHLVNLLNEMDEKHWRKAGTAYAPTMFADKLGNFHGAKIGGGSPGGQKYIVNGNSPAYPPINMNSGLAVHSGGNFAGVDGAVGSGRNAPVTEMKGGKKKYGVGSFVKDFNKIGKLVKPVAKPVLSALTDKAVDVIKGAGKKKKYNVDSFVKDFNKIGKLVKPVAQPIVSALTDKAVSKIQGAGRKPNKRAEIVKKVMQERGVKMIEASKIVKAEGLY